METNKTPLGPCGMTGHDLKTIRASHDLTQQQLADELCLARNTVVAMETGRRTITPRTEKAIRELFAKLDRVRAPRIIRPCAEYSFVPADPDQAGES